MSAAAVSNIANATGRGQASRHAAPHRKNAAQRNPRSDSPYQERTSQKDNPTQALIKQAVDYLIRQLEAGQSDMLAAYLRTMARFHNYSFGNQPHESTSAGRLRAPRSLRHAPVDPFQQISELCRRDRHGSIP